MINRAAMIEFHKDAIKVCRQGEMNFKPICVHSWNKISRFSILRITRLVHTYSEFKRITASDQTPMYLAESSRSIRHNAYWR